MQAAAAVEITSLRVTAAEMAVLGQVPAGEEATAMATLLGGNLVGAHEAEQQQGADAEPQQQQRQQQRAAVPMPLPW